MSSLDDDTAIGGPKKAFQSTLWTMVLAAKDPASTDRRNALQLLIETYWKPVYLFIRRRGSDREAAKDLAQGFFAALLERNFLQYVQRDRGRFRTFLLTVLERYMADEYDRTQAQKRGGGRQIFSIDFAAAEGSMRHPASESPDQLYRRDWALRVMAQALDALRAAYSARGRSAEFDAIRFHLTEGTRGAPSGAELSKTLGVSDGEARKRVYRARVEYREAILDVIRSYTETEDDAREELADLLGAFL